MGTPLWVWGILSFELILLIFVGFRTTRNHVVYLPELFAIPAILLVGLQFGTLTSRNSTHILICLLFLILGFGLGVFFGYKIAVKILKKLTSIELPRDNTSPIILLLFIVTKYSLGYLQAVNLNSELSLQYLIFDISISALFSGYFLGKSTCYIYQLIKASKL